ncbi:MAG: winged helix DNA-binding domain-containing protein [Gordonia sp. (in: high G+C Gram-positive bacteria)]|uniref:winged helix DNA-binding domain-containing protein n=1 Tax=Gordonia sp. (in: high G+C Gram-positive bacteria) TaxID=84139 RepID=UPI0039E5C0B0
MRITAAQWNRTLLHRQHLLERADEDAIEVIDRCVGLRSEDPQAAFFALWSRIDGFDPAELDDLITRREVVRTVLLRGTVHLMDALDARWIRSAVQPALDSVLADQLCGLGDVDVLLARVRRMFDDDAGSPVTDARIREELTAASPEVPAEVSAAVVRARLPLVQVPPRGLWRREGEPTYRLLDQWIGAGDPAVTGVEARKDLIRMYLRGYGPASAAAVSAWCGLPGTGSLLAEMESDWELARLTGPDGQELYDLEGLRLAAGDEPAPVRLLAPQDVMLVADADGNRVADPDVYAATGAGNGRSPGFVLVDGRLAGTWRLTGGAVELTELTSLSPADRVAVAAEAAELAEFASR